MHSLCLFSCVHGLLWLTNGKISKWWRWTWMISWNKAQISTQGKLVTPHAERSQRSIISQSMFPGMLTMNTFHPHDKTSEIARCGGTHLKSSHLGDGGRRIWRGAGHQSGLHECTQAERIKCRRTAVKLSTLCRHLKGWRRGESRGQKWLDVLNPLAVVLFTH